VVYRTICAAALLALAFSARATDAGTATAPPSGPTLCAAGAMQSGAAENTFDLAAWPDRSYDLELPASYVCGEPIGVVLIYHGGGGNRQNMRTLTCPGGDAQSPRCFDRIALAAGLAVVFPDGTSARAGRLLVRDGLRTWNAGGGKNGYICVSGGACKSGVDDLAYTNDLLADLRQRIRIDGRRVFASGFSNGAAMVQRLACEAAETFAAIAPVSGENQFALDGCTPSARVAVLDIHGTLDRCWPYDGGRGGCIESGLYVSVAETLAGWAARNGCDPSPSSTALPPRAGIDDGTSVVRVTYANCAAGGALEHLRIVGNGHYWPDGHSYARGRLLGGTMSRQLDAGQAIVDFFMANARP
jgi:polyhydroxybutyrate depolymerase